MTIYSYKCPKCGVFDREYGMGEQPMKVACVKCHATCSRSFSAPATHTETGRKP